MRTSSPLWLLAALGALSLTMADPAAAADPSEWTCELCPFEDKPVTRGSVDVGIGAVLEPTATSGDFTGFDQRGGFAVLGASLRHSRENGFFARLDADDLGLDVRSLRAAAGREGAFSVRFGYAEIPHIPTGTALTPFSGIGSGSLALPAGFPAATTADMPLAATLQPLEIGFDRKRTDLGATLLGPEGWTFRIDTRHHQREGTLRSAGSFFFTSAQLAAPVDQITDQVEVSASYAATRLQASVTYHGSSFRNHDDALTWQHPFTNLASGATAGQLALPPDNQFHQLSASVGYQVSPALRASGEVAVGRMTQDQSFLGATTDPTLAAAIGPLPAASLDGRADTLDASVRLSYAASERLRLAATATRNERDNQTRSLAWPAVSTDMFVGAASRTNLPYSFTRDRFKLTADWRGPRTLTLAGGAEHDTVERTLQETDETREVSAWVRASARPMEAVTASLKLAHSERDHSDYGIVPTVQPPQNPLLRKYYQADRRRDAVGLHVDAAIGESSSLGMALDVSADDYDESPIGLTDARSASLAVDLSVGVSDETRVRAFAGTEHTRSRQAGSQSFALPDWTGRTRDTVDLLGVGITHQALGGKLGLAADVTSSRARSRVEVASGSAGTPFPVAKTGIDSLKLSATWRLKDDVSLIGSFWHERYESRDWRLDGVLPATVPNLLAFGEQPPHYHVSVLRVAVRYRF